MAENIYDFTGVVLDENDEITTKKTDDVSDSKSGISAASNQSVSNNASGASSTAKVSSTNQQDDQDKKLKLALIEYKNQNYTTAFGMFKKLAEDRNVEAAFMLGNMYTKGIGPFHDVSLGKHWLKLAADKGHFEAAFDYAIILLSNGQRTAKETTEGFYYLQIAGENGYKPAIDKYIQLVCKGLGGKKESKKASVFCATLANQAKDSFDAEKYRELAKKIKVAAKNSNSTEMSTKSLKNHSIYAPRLTWYDLKIILREIFFTIIELIGEIIYLVAAYIVLGVYTYAEKGSNSFSNFIFLLLGENLTNQCINEHVEVFNSLAVAMVIGAALITLGNKAEPTNKFFSIIKVIYWILFVALIAFVFINGLSEDGATAMMILIIGCRLGGWILGLICGFVLSVFGIFL